VRFEQRPEACRLRVLPEGGREATREPPASPAADHADLGLVLPVAGPETDHKFSGKHSLVTLGPCLWGSRFHLRTGPRNSATWLLASPLQLAVDNCRLQRIGGQQPVKEKSPIVSGILPCQNVTALSPDIDAWWIACVGPHRGAQDVLKRVDLRQTVGKHLLGIPAILAAIYAESTARHQAALV
jgi:hypothetical protein